MTKSDRTDWVNKLIPEIKAALQERISQGVPTATVRGIFYILVSKGLIENLPTVYQQLSKALVSARENNVIPYEWITDDSRQILNINDKYFTPEKTIRAEFEVLRDLPTTYQDYIPRWHGQPEYVEEGD